MGVEEEGSGHAGGPADVKPIEVQTEMITGEPMGTNGIENEKTPANLSQRYRLHDRNGKPNGAPPSDTLRQGQVQVDMSSRATLTDEGGTKSPRLHSNTKKKRYVPVCKRRAPRLHVR